MKTRSDQRRFWREVFPKFLEAAAIWTVVAAAIGWLTWKEISRRPLATEGGRQIELVSDNAYGVSKRSALVCQGLNVGEVMSVEARTGEGGTLSVVILGNIQPKFENWNFAPEAQVRSTGVTAALAGAPVELTFAGELDPGQISNYREVPQRFAVLPPKDTGEQIQVAIGRINQITKPFAETVPREELPAGWPGAVEPTRASVIASNLLTASTALKEASMKLDREMDATQDDTLMAQLRGVKGNIDEISNEAVALLKELQQTTNTLDEKLDDVLGQTPSQRAQLRSELNQLIETSEEMVEKIDQLIPRVGDTFMGRLLIRKERQPEPVREVR